MAQWKLELRVIVQDDGFSKPVLRASSRASQRPLRADYEDGERCVRMTFVVEGDRLSDAHERQCQIVDSLYKAIDEAGVAQNGYAIEFDPPQVLEAGAKGV